jgi:hypothetical protein
MNLSWWTPSTPNAVTALDSTAWRKKPMTEKIRRQIGWQHEVPWTRNMYRCKCTMAQENELLEGDQKVVMFEQNHRFSCLNCPAAATKCTIPGVFTQIYGAMRLRSP